MKLSDLTEKKGPIIGAPKGSQKDARMGTDDPSKYMRGGEWEAYREPQGVSSDAGKIAGGQKKGTTRTKNKKTSESVYSDKKLFKTQWKPAMLPDPKDAPQVAPFASPPDGVDGIDFIVDFGVRDKMKGKAYKGDKRKRVKAAISGANPANAKDPRSIKLVKESPIYGGPGSDNDFVTRQRDATTMDLVTDTNKATRSKTKLPGSEAPTKKVLKTVKKSLDDRPGNVSDINEQVKSIVSEAIPRVMPRDYNADYELMDDKNEEVIGVARIAHGVVEILSVRNDLAEDYEGHIMSRLLSTIVRDADLADANLAIPMDNPNNLGQKRFLERFGFRDTGNGILKRNAGSVTPPSVLTARL